ncbi:hypothetical protein HMPREF1487_09473 [Pseudomonas sp. HPB0071]|uniref:Uncharacterized protein n=1 Tax=Pseudomonas luteola TaxID=47886 RepID=A0A2X2DW93_PSELU|nr:MULTISPECIES: hypothetical protein [Pseudomonas]ENA26994.1 hypothetical protein HMPREF1487_09473 [Pseudomonas sp. HPB0071]MBA1250178.1 hypothetical protein [Pseudomonas zeshuii]MBH3440929.1 hypothetical protein [Pseudomonas luteola]SPY99969.1 Uncharacterised protein [Pseudomonas luteola]
MKHGRINYSWLTEVYSATNKMLRWTGRCLPILAPLLIPSISMASSAGNLKISDFANDWKAEFKTILPVFLLGVAFLGICFAAVSVISAIIAKKNQRPLEWQVWGITGGAVAVIIPVLILAVAGSLSSNKGNASSVMSDLGI